MKIGVIGSGKIGGTIGKKWQDKGHQVVFGSRNPEAGRTVSWLDAVKFADVILVAIPGQTVGELTSVPAAEWKDKIVIDATNRFDGVANLSAFKELGPGVKVVRAFNSVGVEVIANPVFGDEVAAMFFAATNADTKPTATGLIKDIGFEPVYLGDESAFPGIDAFVTGIWFPLTKTFGRGVAVKVLSR